VIQGSACIDVARSEVPWNLQIDAMIIPHPSLGFIRGRRMGETSYLNAWRCFGAKLRTSGAGTVSSVGYRSPRGRTDAELELLLCAKTLILHICTLAPLVPSRPTLVSPDRDMASDWAVS